MAESPQHRLQIATRIHFVLMRELGQGIDVERMLKQERYARDVLLVCEACRGTDLERLAREYRAAGREMPVPTKDVGQAARPMDWSKDTSGFGLGDEPAPHAARRAEAAADAQPSWWQRLLPR